MKPTTRMSSRMSSRMSRPITETQCALERHGNREGAENEDTSSPGGLSMFFSVAQEATGDLAQK
jgi:hypothetical protein